eukprot:c21878_g2_i1.p1 GENE.c21878_g2_i1~~c21878_g2_i1.p1  ORF type:complete len:955 (+),score=506.29 c21878_g2_i1:72-2867(+)
MTIIEGTNPHFIRCIKPNSAKISNEFQGLMVLQQLRYSGVLEAVRIRKSGFPFRYLHKIFYQRYKILVLGQNFPHYPSNYRDYCVKLVDAVRKLPGYEGIEPTDLQVGKTMMLYRSGPYRILELQRNIKLGTIALVLQKQSRKRQVMKQIIMIKKLRPVLKAAIQSRNEEKLEAALKQSSEITIAELDEVKKCRNVLAQVKEEKVINAKIEALFKRPIEEVFDDLSAVVSRADDIELTNNLIAKAKEEVRKIQEKRQCTSDLIKGVEKQSLTLLEDAFARARNLMMASSSEAKKAKEWIDILKTELVVVEKLQRGMKEGALQRVLDHSTVSVTTLESAISEGSKLTFQGQQIKQIFAEAKVLLNARKALLQEDYKSLEKFLGEILKMQIDQQSDEVLVMKEELTLKCARDDVEEKLEKAVSEFDLESLDLGTGQAEKLGMLPNEFPVVGVANHLKERLRLCKQHLYKGLQHVLEDDLRYALEIANEIKWNNSEVQYASDLYQNVLAARLNLEIAYEMCDPELLNEWYLKATEIKYESEIVLQTRELLYNTPNEKFLRLQYNAAKKLGFIDRQIEVTMQLKESIFAQFASMFELENFGVLRGKEEYSSHAWVKKDKVKEGYLKYQKGNLLTSLTRIEDPNEIKVAKDAFKNVQGYMGDRQYEFTEPLVQELITICIQIPAMRDEVLVQVIKQLIDNPNTESISKGWELLFFLIYSFPPSDDICNYLTIFVRAHPEHRNLERCIHEANFRDAKEKVPTISEMRSAKQAAYSSTFLQDIKARQKAEKNRFVEFKLKEKQSLGAQQQTDTSLSVSSLASSATQKNEIRPRRKTSVQILAEAILPERVSSQNYSNPAPVRKGPPTSAPPLPVPTAPTLPLARAAFDYFTGEPGHLNIRAGDLIYVQDKHPSGWWTGSLKTNPDVLGVFPGSYVQDA